MYKKIFTLFSIVAAFSPAFSQDISTDSLVTTSDSVRIFQDRRSVPINSLGYYTFTTSDKIGMQTYAGFNVLNVLRGHVPNLTIGRNASSVSSSLRNNNTMMLLDGVPFSSAMTSYYNFNSFDFQSISSVSSGNGLALYGGLGANGALILESKTGKDIERPHLELNSFTTFSSYPKQDEGFIQREKSDQWMFTNSIAYAQDFGAVDTRVSYNNTYLPDASSEGKTGTIRNAIKINTGFDISPRFTARLSADALNSDYMSHDEAYSQDFDDFIRSRNGNLALKFLATDWLAISSQTAVNWISEEAEQEFNSDVIDYDIKRKRAFTNLFFSITPKINEKIGLSILTGAQIDRQNVNTEILHDNGANQSESTFEEKVKSRSSISRVNLNVTKTFFADVNYRLDHYVDAEDDYTNQSTYSFNAAFVFSEAFHLTSQWFQSGKLRGSIGKTTNIESPGFPYTNNRTYSSLLGSPVTVGNPGLTPTARTSQELGLDFSLVQSRIIFNSTYFNNVNDKTIVSYYSPLSGQFVTMNIGELRMKGIEFALAGIALQHEHAKLLTKVVYSRYNARVDVDEDADIRLSNLDNTIPKWSGSFLTQLSINNFFVALLITHDKNDPFGLYDRIGNPIGDVNLTQTWLRDLSAGYNFNKVSISLSGRNIWRLSGDPDFTNRSQTTISASVSVRIN